MTLENDKGERRSGARHWGSILERAMKEDAPEIGDKIGLRHMGSEPVRLPDGTTAERNAWKMQDAGERPYSQ